MPATIHHQDRIALVFDFDETLGEDCADALIRHLGKDADAFRRDCIDPLEGKWDRTLARLYAILRAADECEVAITRELMAEVGGELELFEGVTRMFGRLRGLADEIAPGVEVEFYIVSGGFVDMIQATAIADEFRGIYGCQLYYDPELDGAATFPRRIITNAEKTRYLLAICKGLEVIEGDSPRDVEKPVPRRELHVPFEQMIYVGDGASDLPAFGMIQGNGGIAIGVMPPGRDAEGWAFEARIWEERAIENLAEARYEDGSELMRSLELAVRSRAALIALRRLGEGD